MTVADANQCILGSKDRSKRSAQSAFLTAIDGVENEGADGQNWTYTVNGQIADRSFAVYELKPGDQVLWTFGRGSKIATHPIALAGDTSP